jgi:hypothetical protein
MAFRIQIFHAESGFFMNTNHEADVLDDLKRLLADPAFDGGRSRVVDAADHVVFEPAMREPRTPPSIHDLAKALGVPVRDPRELYGDDVEGE